MSHAACVCVVCASWDGVGCVQCGQQLNMYSCGLPAVCLPVFCACMYSPHALPSSKLCPINPPHCSRSHLPATRAPTCRRCWRAAPSAPSHSAAPPAMWRLKTCWRTDTTTLSTGGWAGGLGWVAGGRAGCLGGVPAFSVADAASLHTLLLGCPTHIACPRLPCPSCSPSFPVQVGPGGADLRAADGAPALQQPQDRGSHGSDAAHSGRYLHN